MFYWAAAIEHLHKLQVPAPSCPTSPRSSITIVVCKEDCTPSRVAHTHAVILLNPDVISKL